jgi:alpha-glucosidase (family GH31 glycosyl hydrolase)
VLFRGVSKQWMMGESLLVSPVIQKDTEELEAHFTTGTW